jgi:molybdate transport system substrate-binding protein
MKAILADLTPEFERSTGHKLIINYAPADAVKAKIIAGDAADVAITLKPLVAELAKDGKIVGGVDIGRSFIAVAVRSGAPKPDISSVEAFKRSLLAAHSIAYSDPPKGGISGIYFARLIDRMGLADQMRPKTRLVAPGGGPLVEAVAKGDAEIGVDQLSSLVNKPGIDVVGILPKEFDIDIVMSAGVIVGARQPDAAAAFVRFLSSPTAAPIITARGMQPG